jgi:hypothetical protein
VCLPTLPDSADLVLAAVDFQAVADPVQAPVADLVQVPAANSILDKFIVEDNTLPPVPSIANSVQFGVLFEYIVEDAPPPACSIPLTPPLNEDPILNGSNYDQRLLIKFSSPAPSPPTPRISSPPASPTVPFKSTSPFDQLEELDFLPVITPHPPTCRRPNLKLLPAL